MPVVEAIRADMLSAGLKAAEQRAVRDAGKFEPGLQGDDRAGEFLDPRPISSSRQPVFPRRRMMMPWSTHSIHPRPSSVWSGPQSRPVISLRAKPAGEADEEDGAIAQSAQIPLKRFDHAD